MKEEIKRIESLLAFHYFIHERIFRETKNGYIKKDKAMIILRRNHNIPKDECPIIFRGLEILGLIKLEGQYFQVRKPKKGREELVLEFKKKLNLV